MRSPAITANSVQIDEIESLGEQLVRMIDVLLTR